MSRPARSIKARVADWLGAAHIAGGSVDSAVRVCIAEQQRGHPTTIGPWFRRADPAELVAETYELALDAMSAAGLDSYLSIKAPNLAYDEGLFERTLQAAARTGMRLHFDSMEHQAAPQSLQMLEYGLEQYQNLSYTLPSAWERSLQDAERLIELGVSTRVVKGQWSDPGNPDLDPRSGFLRVVDVLAGRASHVQVATHDRRVAKEALRRLMAAGTDCSLEQLHGLPRIPERHVPVGVPVRVYVPFGEAFLPYGISQLRHRPGVLLWIGRDLLVSTSRRITERMREW
jgi:proline dehydrogenase